MIGRMEPDDVTHLLKEERVVGELEVALAVRLHADLSAEEAVRKYKELWRVEQCYREAKSLLRTRPVYHRTDAAIRGHIFCSFLALVLKQTLEARMRAAGIKAEWEDVVRDLGFVGDGRGTTRQAIRGADAGPGSSAADRPLRGGESADVVRRCDEVAGQPAPEQQRDAIEAP